MDSAYQRSIHANTDEDFGCIRCTFSTINCSKTMAATVHAIIFYVQKRITPFMMHTNDSVKFATILIHFMCAYNVMIVSQFGTAVQRHSKIFTVALCPNGRRRKLWGNLIAWKNRGSLGYVRKGSTEKQYDTDGAGHKWQESILKNREDLYQSQWSEKY